MCKELKQFKFSLCHVWARAGTFFKYYYNLKRCLKKECCKRFRHVKLKITMTKWFVQNTHRTTQKHAEHQDITDTQKKYFVVFFGLRFWLQASKKCFPYLNKLPTIFEFEQVDWGLHFVRVVQFQRSKCFSLCLYLRPCWQCYSKNCVFKTRKKQIRLSCV